MFTTSIKYPSHLKHIDIPVFALSWCCTNTHNNYLNTHECITALAFCGGGGSARTGVANSVRLFLTISSQRSLTREVVIETGKNLAVCVKLSIQEGNIWMYVGLMDSIEVHLLSSLPLNSFPVLVTHSSLKPKYVLQSLAINYSGKSLVVGCTNGHLLVYHLVHFNNDETFPKHVLILHADMEGHLDSICDIDFNPTDDIILASSSRDGTCRVWNMQSKSCVDVLQCQIDNKGTGTKILVRACTFGDKDGRSIYTCQSFRKGSGYLSRWNSSNEVSDNLSFHEQYNKCVTPSPITAMSISADYYLIVLGDTSGSITVLSTGVDNRKDGNTLMKWNEVHDLPVTGLEARPCSQYVRIPGEEQTGVKINFISTSADNRIAFLTLQRHAKIKPHTKMWNLESIGSLCCYLLQLVFAWWFLITLFNWITASYDMCHEYFAGWTLTNNITLEWSGIACCIYTNVFWESSDNVDKPVIPF